VSVCTLAEAASHFFTVYYRDGALRLALPPQSVFSKKSASPLVLQLIASAQRMLWFEQQHTQKGGREDGDKLVSQLAGQFLWL
jgi:hypothetical protein